MRRRIRNIIFYIVILFGIVLKSYGQQLPQYSQYMFNSFLLNPAVAGHEGYTAINITAREQWVGIPDAPKTYALSAQTRLMKTSFVTRSSVRNRRSGRSRGSNIGLGGYIFNDKRGIYNNIGGHFAYTYHLKFRKSLLSFGLSGIIYQFKIDVDKINVDDLSIPRFKRIIPDADMGVYFSNRYIYAGLSVKQLFQNQIQFGDATEYYYKSNVNQLDVKVLRQFNLMSGYRFDLIDFVFIEPSFLLKTNFQNSQLDLNLKFYFKEEYWLGFGYRTGGALVLDPVFAQRGSAITAMAGIRVDKYYFGYAFDYNLASISKFSLGSHELMIGAKLGDTSRRYRWLNRY